MKTTIYHNPKCGTSRNVLAMLLASGETPTIVEYLKTPLKVADLKSLLAILKVPVRAILREKGTPYAELGLEDSKWSDDELLGFIEREPILLNRPIVITPKGALLCRPSEAVIPLLQQPLPSGFVKEDGKPPQVISG